MERSQDWLNQALRDLRAAEVNAAAGLHEWAAFAAQQAAEKAVKALLESLHGVARGHSITSLLLRLPDGTQASAEVLEAARQLDQVYVTSRYPNGFSEGAPSDYFSAASSGRLIQHARDILQFCRSHLS
jgi:HEPN domain-containing protein